MASNSYHYHSNVDAKVNSQTAILATVGVVAIILVIGIAIGLPSLQAAKTDTTTQLPPVASQTTMSTITSSSISTSTMTTTSITSTLSGADVIIPDGATFQVQSSYDCVAGHVTQPFNITTISYLEGGIRATPPGVTIYVSTEEDAQTISSGHPSTWVYSSGLTNSTNFNVLLTPGSYVLWTEGADLGCGSTIVTPLEQLTTFNVTETVMLVSTATTT